MKETLSAIVQSLTPPLLWKVYLRMRGLRGIAPWREFGNIITRTHSDPLLSGKFAELYEKYRNLDPQLPKEVSRYRLYNVAFFANLCRGIPGDYVCAGVSYGVAPRIVFDFTDFPSLGKTLHLIDPFEGIISNTSNKIAKRFNLDPEYVLKQYPHAAPVVLHRKRIPLRLPGKFAFVFTDTGNPAADAEALPIFYEGLSPGGILITEQYANNIHHYEPVLRQISVTPLWLASGQGVIFKR